MNVKGADTVVRIHTVFCLAYLQSDCQKFDLLEKVNSDFTGNRVSISLAPIRDFDGAGDAENRPDRHRCSRSHLTHSNTAQRSRK
jgi:hypothetical protein